MKKTIAQDITERVQAKFPEVQQSVAAYLSPVGDKTSADYTKQLIAGNSTASELLARGYPQYVAENVARSQEDQ